MALSSRLNSGLAVAEARSFDLQDFLCFKPLTLLLSAQLLLIGSRIAGLC
jgi:hypothetical protein